MIFLLQAGQSAVQFRPLAGIGFAVAGQSRALLRQTAVLGGQVLAMLFQRAVLLGQGLGVALGPVQALLVFGAQGLHGLAHIGGLVPAEAGFADATLFNEFADVDLWHGNAPRSFLMYFPPKRAPQRGFPAFFRLHMVLLYQAPLPNATKNFPCRAGRPAWLGKG